VDLYQLHNPSKKIIEEGVVFDVLEKLKKSGKIREYGVSIFDPADGVLAIEKAPGVAAVQTVLNMLEVKSAEKLLPFAQKNRVAVIAREPLSCGLLAGKITAQTVFAKEDHRAGWPKEKIKAELKKLEQIKQLWEGKPVSLAAAAIEFVLSFDAVSVVIPGGKRPAQIAENLAAVKRQNLSANLIQKIVALRLEAPYTD
jgi:aryl-alcohol dehydrogenase-like predicted oxidoreductase